MTPRIAIAGSGLAGLGAADSLCGRAVISVFERLPVPGGDHWRDRRIRELIARCEHGVRFMAGTQAIRWDDRRLTAMGTQGLRKEEFDALIVATGHRPLTRGEMGIQGSRCGGIMPVTVALHLLQHGVCLGRRPAVIGGSDWAFRASSALLANGATKVSLVAPKGVLLPSDHPLRIEAGVRVTILNGLLPVAIRGGQRVRSLELDPAVDGHGKVDCDAVILADGHVPLRNIDGAIYGAEAVAYAQSGVDPSDDDASERSGRAAAEEVMAQLSAPQGVAKPFPRIGGRS